MLAQMKLTEYLDAMASDAPAPGGGSAAALCGAQGAGLTAMVAGLTMGKKKYAPYAKICQEVREEALLLTEQLKAQIDRDTQAFNLVAEAFRMPKTSEEEKAARSGAIREGMLVSTQVPFETMQLALKALQCAHRLLNGFNEGAASDLGVAAENLRTCVRGAWMNVCINLGSLKDEEKAAFYREQGGQILSMAEELAGTISHRAERLILR